MTTELNHAEKKSLNIPNQKWKAKVNLSSPLFLIFPCLILLFIHIYGGPHPGDDAYITYRYVKNLVLGNGFIYNHGENVLGTTTPLYTLILAFLSSIFGLNYLLWTSLALNTGCNLISLYLLWRISQKLLPNNLLVTLAVMLYALNPAIAIQSKLGMETPLYIVTGLAALYYISTDSIKTAALCSALHLLTRPDGLILVLVILAYLLLTIPEKAGKYLLITTAVILPWLIFAFYKFGSPIPHTLIAKSQAYASYPWLFVKYYWRHLRRSFWGYFFAYCGAKDIQIFGAIALFFILLGMVNLGRKRQFNSLFVAYPLVYISAFILANPFYNPRYITPMEPFLIVFVLYGIYSAFEKRAGGRPIFNSLISLLYGFLVISQLFHYNIIPGMWFRLSAALGNQGTYDPAWLHPIDCRRQDVREDLFRKTSLYLNNYIDENTVIALPEIGTFGYYSRGKILDTVGLVSPEALAYYPLNEEQIQGNNAIPPDLIYARLPDYIVTYEVFLQKSLAGQTRFKELYTLFRTTDYFHFWGDDRLMIFKKKSGKS